MNLNSIFSDKLSEVIDNDNQNQAFCCLKNCYELLLKNKDDIEVEKTAVDGRSLLYLNFLTRFKIYSEVGDYIECCHLLKDILELCKITEGVINNMLYCLHEIDGKVVASYD
ncbi:hypothetical protein AB3329_01955 [Streptococcus sp. H31]|uniref:hypothetical protein n=1 Tax=Streptococcus huangxiaojuni TaxID=3237239 RepID=UPI0034A18A42